MGRAIDRLKEAQRKYAARVAKLVEDGMDEVQAREQAKVEGSEAMKAKRARLKGTNRAIA